MDATGEVGLTLVQWVPPIRGPYVVERLVGRDIITTAEHIDLAVENACLVIGPGRPSGMVRRERPVFSVGGGPNVVLEATVVAEIIILGSAKQPHLPFEDDHGGRDTRGPTGILRGLLPAHSIIRFHNSSLLAE